MTTRRKPLIDENGDYIIPAMTGDQTKWVKTGDIDDGAVTADKIDFTTMESSAEMPNIDCNFGKLHICTRIATAQQGYAVQVSAEIPNEFYGYGKICFYSCTPTWNNSSINKTYSVWTSQSDGKTYINATVDSIGGTNNFYFCVLAWY